MKTIEERFWEKVDKRGSDECWLWTASSSQGYGRLWNGKRPEGAHRISFRIHGGEIPDGQHVLHRCDNPPCVNPAHLFVGTSADNMADKVAKGRLRVGSTSGESHPRALLSQLDVLSIREKAHLGSATWAQMAASLGVSVAAICDVVTRRSWAHLPDPGGHARPKIRRGPVPVGERFGSLTVKSSEIDKGSRRMKVLTMCDCGRERVVLAGKLYNQSISACRSCTMKKAGRLSDSDIDNIRKLLEQGVRREDIAQRFSVGTTTIGNIANGRRRVR